MLALSTIIADITINNTQLIDGLIAVIVGLIAEFLVGWRLPFGFVGAIIMALIGIWLLTSVISVGIPDFKIQEVPIIHALIGGIIFVALWQLVTYRLWRGRPHIYRRFSGRYE